MQDFSISYTGPTVRWHEVIAWCDELTPGWFFALDAIPSNSGRTVRESLEFPRRRDLDFDAHATLTFTRGDHLMLFKLTWTGVE